MSLFSINIIGKQCIFWIKSLNSYILEKFSSITFLHSFSTKLL